MAARSVGARSATPRPGRRSETSRRPGAGRSATPAAPARTTAGAAVRAGSPAALRSSLERASAGRARRRARPSTARLAAVAVVLGLLIISYASSVRSYLAQRSEIAAARADIAQRQQEIAVSQGRIEQWSDPAYVEIIARQRFGLVLPGEHLYLPVDDPGASTRPATVTPTVGGAKVTVPPDSTWWSRVAGSVGAAGQSTAPAASTTPPASTTAPASTSR